MSERSPDIDVESERIGAAIRSLSATVQAPPSLRERIAAPAPARPRRWRTGLVALGAAGSLAAIAAVLVIVLGGGTGSGAPSLADTATAALRAPAGPAPGVDRSDRDRLLASGAGLRFPNWHNGRLSWRAVGSHRTEIGGRTVTTVSYANHSGDRIGYAIVEPPAIEPPRGTQRDREYGIAATVTRAHGRNVVSWRRAGRTCVLASRTVPPEELMMLAAWHGGERAS